jgi:hypothetical protein
MYKYLLYFVYLYGILIEILTASVVSVLPSSVVDRGFESRSGKTKDYEIGICCFSAKHAVVLRRRIMCPCGSTCLSVNDVICNCKYFYKMCFNIQCNVRCCHFSQPSHWIASCLCLTTCLHSMQSLAIVFNASHNFTKYPQAVPNRLLDFVMFLY